jgi:hypothetical protein
MEGYKIGLAWIPGLQIARNTTGDWTSGFIRCNLAAGRMVLAPGASPLVAVACWSVVTLEARLSWSLLPLGWGATELELGSGEGATAGRTADGKRQTVGWDRLGCDWNVVRRRGSQYYRLQALCRARFLIPLLYWNLLGMPGPTLAYPIATLLFALSSSFAACPYFPYKHTSTILPCNPCNVLGSRAFWIPERQSELIHLLLFLYCHLSISIWSLKHQVPRNLFMFYISVDSHSYSQAIVLDSTILWYTWLIKFMRSKPHPKMWGPKYWSSKIEYFDPRRWAIWLCNYVPFYQHKKS